MLNKRKSIRNLTLAALLLTGAAALAQTTGSGVINATLFNKNGISLQFDTDASGVTLGRPAPLPPVRILEWFRPSVRFPGALPAPLSRQQVSPCAPFLTCR